MIFKCLPEVHVLVLPPLIRVKDQPSTEGNFVKAPANISLDLFHIGKNLGIFCKQLLKPLTDFSEKYGDTALKA